MGLFGCAVADDEDTNAQERTAFAPTPRDDGMDHNGLSQHSLFANALTTNPKAVALLRQSPLNTSTFASGYLHAQLADSRARDVMVDLVACALPPGQQVDYQGAQHVTFEGELGICALDQDDWHTGAPSERCLQLVTACLLSRVNGLYRYVPISEHSNDPAIPLRAHVPVEPRMRESVQAGLATGTPIPLFGSNATSATQSWSLGDVGTCSQGLVALPATSGIGAYRVCGGMYACPPPSYAGLPAYVETVASGTSPPSFMCPPGGVFSVMHLQQAAPSSQSARLAPAAQSPYTLVATERAVFAYPEGAFYGDIFDDATQSALPYTWEVSVETGELTKQDQRFPPHADTDPQSPYLHLWACYNSREAGPAIMNDRICAQHDANCFPHAPELCSKHCTFHDDAFEGCTDPHDASAHYPAITTFLNDPCDLLDAKTCLGLRERLASRDRPQLGDGGHVLVGH